MPDIHGNIEGVRRSTLMELQTLYDYPIDRDEYLPTDLAKILGRYSCALNREISIYIDRDGEVIDITIGDTASVPLTDIRLRRSTGYSRWTPERQGYYCCRQRLLPDSSVPARFR